MKKIFFALLALWVGSQQIFSQSLGQNDLSNTAQTTDESSTETQPSLRIFPYQWIDLTEPSKESTAFISDFGTADMGEAVDNIQMGMTFEYFGEKYSSLNIVSNGFVALAGQGPQPFLSYLGVFPPTGIPSTSLPNNVIAPFWVDLDWVASKGFIFYKTFKPEKDNKKSDHIIIQWEDAGMFADYNFGTTKTVRLTFQVVLFSEGGILFQYKKINADAIRESINSRLLNWTIFTADNIKTLTDFDILKSLSTDNISIGYEDKSGTKGASWTSSISSSMALGNELVPEWVSGSGGENFLDFVDGRDRRNNAVTSSGGCFLSQKKSALDR